MDALKYILIFILGLLFQYIFNLLDLAIQHLQNKQTLQASKMQEEINKLSENEQELQPAIGFHVANNLEEDYDYDE